MAPQPFRSIMIYYYVLYTSVTDGFKSCSLAQYLIQNIQCLAKVLIPLGFLFGYHAMDIHKIVQIGEVK
jgi:hypothetical protein